MLRESRSFFTHNALELAHIDEKRLVEDVIACRLYTGSFAEAKRLYPNKFRGLETICNDSPENYFYQKYRVALPARSRPQVTMPDLDLFFQMVLSSTNPEKMIVELFQQDSSGFLEGNIYKVCNDVFQNKTIHNAIGVILKNSAKAGEIVVGQDTLRAPYKTGGNKGLWSIPMMYCDAWNTDEELREIVTNLMKEEVLTHRTMEQVKQILTPRRKPEWDTDVESAVPSQLSGRHLYLYNVDLTILTFDLMNISADELEAASKYSRLKHMGFATIDAILDAPIRHGVWDALSSENNVMASINTKIRESEVLRRFFS